MACYAFVNLQNLHAQVKGDCMVEILDSGREKGLHEMIGYKLLRWSLSEGNFTYHTPSFSVECNL